MEHQTDREMLIEIRTELKDLRKRLLGSNGIGGKCYDHEQRLRALERFRWMAVGVAACFGAGAGTLLAELVK